MDRTAADSYVYAKACGMYARSFVGPRARRLFEPKRLRDLWSMLYGGEVPLVPEGLLALLLERKSEENAVRDVITLLSSYDTPDPLTRALLSLYDYSNLKAASAWAALGRADPPFMVNLGAFAMLDYSAWPDIGAMTRSSPVSWYDRVPEEGEQMEWESRLDHEYYRSLWKAFSSVSSRDRAAIEELIREEIVLQNIVWAIRLRVYYRKTEEEILPLLAGHDEEPRVRETLCGPALDTTRRAIDARDEWKGWKYAWLLNPGEEGVPWEIDPRWAQFASEKHLYRRALRLFHQHPFTLGVLVAFFKIKQLEEQNIRVAAEGIRLGATEGQISEFMGDTQDA